MQQHPSLSAEVFHVIHCRADAMKLKYAENDIVVPHMTSSPKFRFSHLHARSSVFRAGTDATMKPSHHEAD